MAVKQRACELAHDDGARHPAAVRLTVRSQRTQGQGRPMERVVHACRAHVRELRSMGIEICSLGAAR